MSKFEIQHTILNDKIIHELVKIWECSVTATHDFLTKEDIKNIKFQVISALNSLNSVVCVVKDCTIAFMVVENRKIEMLFVDSKYFHQGIGKALLKYAIDELNAIYDDVNEDNVLACKFYKNYGFEVFEITKNDELGNPFAILKMKLHDKIC